MTTVSEYVLQNPDSSIAWNYNHIARYPNLPAAEQWLQAKVNAEIENKRFNYFLDLYERTGIEKHLHTASAANKACVKWEDTATAFGKLLYDKDGTYPSPIISGGEVLDLTPVQNDGDIPF